MTGSRSLTIEFCGMRCLATDEFTFGRSADLVLDADNAYLHGEAGRLQRRGEDWFVRNTGSRLHLELLHQTGLYVELPPSADARMPAGNGHVRVTAGGTTYEFGYHRRSEDPETVTEFDGGNTLFYGRDLTPAQIDYAVTFARFRLQGLRKPPPTQPEIARLWQVTPRAVNKTFEDIRRRLRDEGVRRIGTQEDLLEHLVLNRIVTIEHLEAARLDRPDGPVRRSDILRESGDGRPL